MNDIERYRHKKILREASEIGQETRDSGIAIAEAIHSHAYRIREAMSQEIASQRNIDRLKERRVESIKSKGVSSMKKKDKFTIKFYTQKEFCHCCDRELDEAELSEMREFDFYAEQLQEDIDWKLYDESELEEVVLGYVFDTIEFFAVKAYDNMVLFEGEVDRMIEYVKENLM